MSESRDMSPSSRKIVQRVKEVVDLSEAEIYTTLRDCDMDPDEAVYRLTEQGKFLEVKRKREKKSKEAKAIKTTYRGPTKIGASGGSKNGPDGRYIGNGSSTHYSTSEVSSMHGKLTYGNGNVTTGYTSYISPVSDVPGNNKSNGPYGHSNGVSAENEQPSLGKADNMTYVVQSTLVHQSPLTGAGGQLTMADIVKLGRPLNTISNGHNTHEFSSHGSNIRSSNEDRANEFHHDGVANSDWPPLGKHADGEMISVPEYAVDPKINPEEYSARYEGSNQHYVEEKIQESEKGIETNGVGSNNHSSKKIPEKVSMFDDAGEEHDGSVSVVSRDLQRLSLENADRELPSDEEEPSVIIPDHLQVQSAYCSHLSFGSFQPAKCSTYALGIETSAGTESGFEGGLDNKDDVSLADRADTRPPKLYADYDRASDGSLLYGNVAPEGIYGVGVASRHEEPKQYSFTSSVHDRSFDDSLSAALNQTSTRVQNHALLSNILQSYGKPVSISSLAANAQPSRELDHPAHQLLYPTLRSMPAIYENASPVPGGSAISISEALKAAAMRPPQPPLPQHLDSQPLGPYADTLGYEYNKPSGFNNQTLARESTLYLQSSAAGFPYYEASAAAAAAAPRHGNFDRTTSIHGDYPPIDSPPSFPIRSLRYDDGSSFTNSYYRQLLSLQQNESSANWLRRQESPYHNRQGQIPQQQLRDYVIPRYNYHYQNGSSNSPHDHQQQYRGDF